MVLETLVGTVGRVAAMKKSKILQRDYSTDFALDLLHKDLTQTMQAANEATVPMPLLGVTREIIQQARKEGKGGQDFSIIADVTERD
jgi:3-hydroxyisobutyrate dehydrogenase-like beta-hydroxyacid dehydrogenase